MSTIKSITEVMAEMHNIRHSSTLVVRDWRTMIPAGSRWHPGDPGNPKCKSCEGTGYLRIEGLPMGHRYFGKLVLCECARVVAQKVQESELEPEMEQDDSYMLPAENWPRGKS